MNSEIIKDFKILDEKVNSNKVIYFDNAATTQKPKQVIEAIGNYYKKYNANPHRGAHTLSVLATDAYESARKKVADFINASEEEIIFTKNSTDALNLVYYTYGMQNINENDEIVVLISEHHSNLVPWQQLAISKKAKLNYMYVNKDGILESEEIDKKITKNTKIVAIAHVSNSFGIINPIEEVIKKAHLVGAVVVLDAAQGIPHLKEDVKKLDADFMVFSGHKMLAPMGVGVLYGKKELLEKMPPFLYGGDMIEYVKEQSTTFAALPFKFEAGTQNVEAVVGLGAAIDYIENVGYDFIESHEKKLLEYALEKMQEIPNIDLYGTKDLSKRVGVIAFNVKDVHPHDVASILDSYGVAIRSGHHCAQPFLRYMDLNSTCRASFYIYNTIEEVDKFIEALKSVRGQMGYES